MVHWFESRKQWMLVILCFCLSHMPVILWWGLDKHQRKDGRNIIQATDCVTYGVRVCGYVCTAAQRMCVLESLGRNPFRHYSLRTGLIKNTVDQLQANRYIYLTTSTPSLSCSLCLSYLRFLPFLAMIQMIQEMCCEIEAEIQRKQMEVQGGLRGSDLLYIKGLTKRFGVLKYLYMQKLYR